jgi:hypothetical protein
MSAAYWNRQVRLDAGTRTVRTAEGFGAGHGRCDAASGTSPARHRCPEWLYS